MKRIKFVLEYPLDTTTDEVLWEFIGTAAGLEAWFADKVTFDGRNATFTWMGDETRQAKIVVMRPYSSISFKWVDSPDKREVFELKMMSGELTQEHTLRVTDYADEDELDEMKEIWNMQIEKLRRQGGF